MFVTARALAQAGPVTYPTKPIHLIVGFPAGGGNDVVTRLLAESIRRNLGAPVVVENRVGAGGRIAAVYVAKAAPDGYTLMVASTSQMAMNPVLYENLAYDPIKDFEPISMIGEYSVVLAVSNALKATSVQELIALAKANPGKLKYSSGSSAFQFIAEAFKQVTNTDIFHIPYKGSGNAAIGVVTGDVDLSFADSPAVIAHIKSGKVRPLAVTAAQRVSAFPHLPTLVESGVHGVDIPLWAGLFAPARTPKEIVAKLQNEVVELVKEPQMREKILALGIEPEGSSSEQVRERLRRAIALNTVVAKKGNLKPE